jgi:hypothetical protein
VHLRQWLKTWGNLLRDMLYVWDIHEMHIQNDDELHGLSLWMYAFEERIVLDLSCIYCSMKGLPLPLMF